LRALFGSYALLRREMSTISFSSVRALVPFKYVAASPVVLDVMMQRDGEQAV
jgi:hypothetical protein